MLFARQNSPSTALPSLSMSLALQNLAFQHSSNHTEIGVNRGYSIWSSRTDIAMLLYYKPVENIVNEGQEACYKYSDFIAVATLNFTLLSMSHSLLQYKFPILLE